jgi:hypothetical protein
MTWKSVTYLLINAVVLPAHVVAFIIFPLAGLWARAHAWFTIRMLGPALGVRDMADAASPAASPGSGQVRGGFGLAGMGERVAALGGRLTTGPDPAGGFSVRAVLPLTSVSLAEGGAEEAGDGIGQGDGAGGRSDGAGSGGAGSGSAGSGSAGSGSVSGDGTRGESS